MTDLTDLTVTTLTASGGVTGDLTGDVTGGVKLTGQVLTDDGAITIKSGVVILNKAGAIAATLAAPTATTDDFKVLRIVSITAQAHTITATTIGFNAGDAASDVATLGGAIADGLSVVAYQGEWYVLTNNNATLA